MTVAELAALAANDPYHARRLLPPRSELKRLGLSTFTGRTPPPFPVEFREQFCATLKADPDFRRAVAHILGVE